MLLDRTRRFVKRWFRSVRRYQEHQYQHPAGVRRKVVSEVGIRRYQYLLVPKGAVSADGIDLAARCGHSYIGTNPL